ncbi:phosphotransferase, partial [Streptomyces sp. NPDC002623]
AFYQFPDLRQARVLAHRGREVGLANWGHPQGYLRRQLDRWRAQWDLVATRPLLELLRLHRALEAAVPSESGVSIVHGDFRVDDLGTFLAYRGPAVDALLDSPAATDPGFPDQMELADQYELLSGRDISLLPFYQALAYFKIAVFAEGVYSRHLQGVTVGDGFAGAGTSVPELVRAGLALVGRGR